MSYNVTGNCGQNSSFQANGTQIVKMQTMRIDISEWLRLEFIFKSNSTKNEQNIFGISVTWHETEKNFESPSKGLPYWMIFIINCIPLFQLSSLCQWCHASHHFCSLFQPYLVMFSNLSRILPMEVGTLANGGGISLTSAW